MSVSNSVGAAPSGAVQQYTAVSHQPGADSGLKVAEVKNSYLERPCTCCCSEGWTAVALWTTVGCCCGVLPGIVCFGLGAYKQKNSEKSNQS